MKIYYTIFILFFLFCPAAQAENKQWSGGGDGTTWDQDLNWFPALTPTAADDATVDTQGTSASITKAFNLKSLTLGGRTESGVTTSDFVYGIIAPDKVTSNSVHVRKGGLLTLSGSGGNITLRGTYRSSEEVPPDESSFVFKAE